jgi:undecaprenyl diphosphate synthase
MLIKYIVNIFKNNKKNNVIIDNNNRIPYHVAIIMDGNGRWAKKRGLPRSAGHRAGVKALKRTVIASKELGIKILTVYAFSTENWNRPKDEVDTLMNLLVEYLEKELAELNKNNVKIFCIGKVNNLSEKIIESINKAEKVTKNNNGLILNVALNYGGRTEIVDAAKNIAAQVKKEKLKINDIDENIFGSYLYTKNQKEPDLLIRPSGELRVSNFLLWQIAYTEIFFTNVYWPDFNKLELINAINDYQKRERRFGSL